MDTYTTHIPGGEGISFGFFLKLVLAWPVTESSAGLYEPEKRSDNTTMPSYIADSSMRKNINFFIIVIFNQPSAIPKKEYIRA